MNNVISHEEDVWVKEVLEYISKGVCENYKKNNITHINICGNYATRAELLLSELADICCIFDLVFLSIYSDKKKDSNDTTFTVFLQDDLFGIIRINKDFFI